MRSKRVAFAAVAYATSLCLPAFQFGNDEWIFGGPAMLVSVTSLPGASIHFVRSLGMVNPFLLLGGVANVAFLMALGLGWFRRRPARAIAATAFVAALGSTICMFFCRGTDDAQYTSFVPNVGCFLWIASTGLLCWALAPVEQPRAADATA